jgi:tyrosine aminotransferase
MTGWAVVHDRDGALEDVRVGLHDLSTQILGPSMLIQSIVPFLLEETPASYYEEVIGQLADNARVVEEELAGVPGLKVIQPQGAMYVVVQLTHERSERTMNGEEFTKELLAEQSVFVLPGACFGVENFFRVVIAPPKHKLQEACRRIRAFCEARFV